MYRHKEEIFNNVVSFGGNVIALWWVLKNI